MVRLILLLLLSLPILAPLVRADATDPFDPFDPAYDEEQENQTPEVKSATELLGEAQQLFINERPLDARTKLLEALKKDPKQYRIHMMMSGYYMQHVGHFRLAFRYADHALKLFTEKHGLPPYRSFMYQHEHKQILYLLAQARLNLDNYAGALQTLDEFSSYGYIDEWYAGTRAWILMKLGRLDEAIKVARLGVLSGVEAGRTLNMLGILLSMKGERQQSLDVFKKATEYEFALGKQGQPATPLNNIGEVFKEIFEDSRAESSWLKATALPDGCEHVLPSLNLALLYIEQLNMKGSKRAIDNFESCVAQFPLRNGEEHRALVHLARGRIALHTGRVAEAIDHISQALESRQWFGKIGTDELDMEAAGHISLYQAYKIQNNHLRLTAKDSWWERAKTLQRIATNNVKAWWYKRRGKQILMENLDDFEDLTVRHTDSLLEYPTLGEVLSDVPRRLVTKRITEEEARDPRSGSLIYYQAYLAQNLLENGRKEEGLAKLSSISQAARPQFDRALLVHVETLQLQSLSPDSAEYRKLAQLVFDQKRAQLRNYGLRLPVNLKVTDGTPTVLRALNEAGFLVDNKLDLPYQVTYEWINGEHAVYFEARGHSSGGVRVRGNDLSQTINKFADEVFTETL